MSIHIFVMYGAGAHDGCRWAQRSLNGRPSPWLSNVRHRPDARAGRVQTTFLLAVQRMKASVPMHERTDSFVEAEAAGNTWKRRYPRPDDDKVLEPTWEWLNALPKGARPVHLPKAFPRIANDLSRLWPETAELDSYFEEKEFSPRRDRSGFPPLIKEELLAIHVYSLRNRPASCEGPAQEQMSPR
jgi:hypothetical protein